MGNRLDLYGNKQLLREMAWQYIILRKYYLERNKLQRIIFKFENYDKLEKEVEKELEKEPEKITFEEKCGSFNILLSDNNFAGVLLDENIYPEDFKPVNINKFNEEDVKDLKELYKAFPIQKYWWLIPNLKMNEESEENLQFAPANIGIIKFSQRLKFFILMILGIVMLMLPFLITHRFVAKNEKNEGGNPAFVYTADELVELEKSNHTSVVGKCQVFNIRCFKFIMNGYRKGCPLTDREIVRATEACDKALGKSWRYEKSDY